VFDKTGTLTLGEHRVVALRSTSGLSENDALRLAAAVEQDSEHPLARAVAATARERGLPVSSGNEFQAIPGYGVEATVEGRRLAVGGPNLLERLGVGTGPDLEPFAAGAAEQGQSVIYLVEDRRTVATRSRWRMPSPRSWG
jgi:Cu2+-exporting ATPase